VLTPEKLPRAPVTAVQSQSSRTSKARRRGKRHSPPASSGRSAAPVPSTPMSSGMTRLSEVLAKGRNPHPGPLPRAAPPSKSAIEPVQGQNSETRGSIDSPRSSRAGWHDPGSHRRRRRERRSRNLGLTLTGPVERQPLAIDRMVWGAAPLQLPCAKYLTPPGHPARPRQRRATAGLIRSEPVFRDRVRALPVGFSRSDPSV
jgi:hypothetical protein